jgi:hypothetical protein
MADAAPASEVAAAAVVTTTTAAVAVIVTILSCLFSLKHPTESQLFPFCANLIG